VVTRVRNGESIPFRPQLFSSSLTIITIITIIIIVIISVPFRPQLPENLELGKTLVDVIRSCWQENPEQRPTFQQIRTTLRKMTEGESVCSSLVV